MVWYSMEAKSVTLCSCEFTMLHRNKLDKLSKKSNLVKKGAFKKGSNYKVEVWHHMVWIVHIKK